MGLLEEEARFLVAKYGTAAGPTGLPRTWPTAPLEADPATLLVLLGLLVFIAVLALIYREWRDNEESRRKLYDSIYG